MSGLVLQFAFEYTDENRQKLSEFKSMKDLEKYLLKQNTVEKFANYAEKKGLKRRNLMIQRSHKLLERYINSRIIYNMMSEQAWVEYLNEDDPAIKETLSVFKTNSAFPAPPVKSEPVKKAAYVGPFDYHGTHSKTSYTARLA
jgi:carboxyl-terminal processing protease